MCCFEKLPTVYFTKYFYMTVLFKVYINESRPLTFVRTPSLRSGNEIEQDKENLDPSADIEIDTSTAAVKFSPDANQQKQFAKELGKKENEGLAGQFIVQYDVQRDLNGGEASINISFKSFFLCNRSIKK